MMLTNILIVAILVSTCAPIDGQRSIEFLLDTSQNGGEDKGVVITDSIPVLPGLYKAAKKLCISGPWVFYDAPDFGVGSSDASKVMAQSVFGSGPNDCNTGPGVDSIMKITRSIRALGKTPFELYPLPNFLADRASEIITDQNNLPTIGDLTSVKIGSLVINDPTNNYILCGKKVASCICVDRSKNSPLLVEDFAAFPPKNPIGTVRRLQVVKAGTALDAECKSLPAPSN